MKTRPSDTSHTDGAGNLYWRDRYRRYRLPLKGEPHSFERVTSIAKMADDRTSLEQWKHRRLVEGLARKPELLEQVVAKDEQSLRKVAAQAFDASDHLVAAAEGTRIHELLEHYDRGLLNDQLLELVGTPDGERINAYQTLLDRIGLMPLAGPNPLIERIVSSLNTDIMPEQEGQWSPPIEPYAGTVDRWYMVTNPEGIDVDFVRLEWGDIIVGDIKTSRHDPKKYGTLPMSVQLALYEHAPAIWQGPELGWRSAPATHSQVGVVIWLPQDLPFNAHVRWMSLARGRRCYKTLQALRQHRKIINYEPRPTLKISHTNMTAKEAS